MEPKCWSYSNLVSQRAPSLLLSLADKLVARQGPAGGTFDGVFAIIVSFGLNREHDGNPPRFLVIFEREGGALGGRRLKREGWGLWRQVCPGGVVDGCLIRTECQLGGRLGSMAGRTEGSEVGGRAVDVLVGLG